MSITHCATSLGLWPLETINPRTWARHIVNAWRDLIEDGFPFRLYVVRPTPPAFEHQPPSPHLILVQRPINNLRSVLMSATHVQNHPGQFVRWAMAIEAPVSKATVVFAAHAQDSCSLQPEDARCQAWWGDQMITNPQDIPNGAAIILMVAIIPDLQTAPLGTQHEDDEVWLQQRQITLSPASTPRSLEQEHALLSFQAVSSSLNQPWDQVTSQNCHNLGTTAWSLEQTTRPRCLGAHP